MDAISYEYTKQRKQFGLHPNFADMILPVESIPPEPLTPPPKQFDPSDPTSQYTPLSPLSPSSQPPPKSHTQWTSSLSSSVELDCIPSQSAHAANTERFASHVKGTSHTEGAWPSEVKTNEFVDRQRYVRRLLNEPAYAAAVVSLTRTAEAVIQQNNSIDCYQQYFPEADTGGGIGEALGGGEEEGGSSLELHSSPPSAKTVCVFRDPSAACRSASKISFHPESPHKLAVAYAVTAFQARQTAGVDICSSYIWDIAAPNHPDATLLPSSPLTTLAYNPRSPDHVVGGSYSGLLSFFDLRKGGSSVETSAVERSHHDPIYDVSWVQSRTGNECCSISTDGQLLWWDIRKLRKGYADSMWLEGEGGVRYGGMSLDYKSDAGATRFLVGTEQGVAMLCDRKAKKDSESSKSVKAYYGLTGGAHHGPVYGISRNPFNLKYFLTVGDWSTRLWMEDLREPILQQAYSGAYLTAACWSNTRPAVYYVARSDGCMDVYDLLHRQESSVYSIKVSDAPAGLTSMRMSTAGRLIAIGDANGSVNVVQVSRGLHELQKDEKAAVSAMLERETKREKALEVRKQQQKRDTQHGKTAAAGGTGTLPPSSAAPAGEEETADDSEVLEARRKAEEEFFAGIEEKGGKDGDDREAASPGEQGAGAAEREEEKEMERELEEKEQEAAGREDEEKTNDLDD